MLSLTNGTERCALKMGINTIGGRRADSLAIAELESQPVAATITVSAEAPAVIRRLTAKVVVKVNDQPLGPLPLELRDGAILDVGRCRLIFTDTRAPRGRRASPPPARHVVQTPASTAATVMAMPRLTPTDLADARLVNVQTGERFPLVGARLEIGRDAACSIVLAGAGVSRHHAAVSPEGGGWRLTDQSSNGTLVNGALVAGSHPLHHGDVIRIHEHELRYENDAEAARAAAPANVAATVVLQPAVSEAIAPPTYRGQPPAATLHILRGRMSGTVFRVEHAVCSIGRAEQNDVCIGDESVSAAHATLLRKGDIWYVTDLRSANGTFVDGYRIAGERALPAGAKLRIGAVELVFQPAAQERARGGATRHVAGLVKRLSRLLARSA